MMIKNICIITKGYPSEKRMINTFVEQLVNEFSNYDIKCYVISPQSITQIIFRGIPTNKKVYNRTNANGKKIEVFSPYYISFSNIKKIINTNYLNLYSFEKAVNKIFKKLNKKIKFDIIYAHFIFPSAIVANKLGKKYKIPVFFAYGENGVQNTQNCLGIDKTKKMLEGINGVISVSEENKKRLIENKIVSSDLIEVFPNAVDNNIFFKKDKLKMRKKLGYSKKDFIIIFVGRFIDVKGVNRLSEALTNINNDNIKAIFIGNGPIKPNYKKTIFAGPVDHKNIVDYLSASDLFVLPTISEGCCNAIIEAIFCGLPVISSNEPFNDEILDENCSIRIDTKKVNEIEKAINIIYNDSDLRIKLSKGALKKAKNFTIQTRAKKILEFMKSKIK